jgi:hypothetical protein
MPTKTQQKTTEMNMKEEKIKLIEGNHILFARRLEYVSFIYIHITSLA